MQHPKTPDDLIGYPAQLGIAFADIRLFQRALTHRSYLNEHPDLLLEDNERLEFLGDAVIDFLAAEWLYARLPDLQEGRLTRLRAALVRNEALAGYAAALGLGDMLLMGKGESDGGGRRRPRNLGGAYEAVIGALYLDQGMEAVRAFVHPRFAASLESLLKEDADKDARSRLQEWSQVALGLVPVYRQVEVVGPEHSPAFTVEVRIGETVHGIGGGHSKRAAAQAAARAALDALKQKGLIE